MEALEDGKRGREERRKKREDKEADEEKGGYLHDPCPISLPRDPDSEGGGSSEA